MDCTIHITMILFENMRDTANYSGLIGFHVASEDITVPVYAALSHVTVKV